MATEGPHWELAVGQSPDGNKIIAYFGANQPQFEQFDFLPKNKKYSAKLIDTWNMTTKNLDIEINNKDMFQLPRSEYQALLLTEKE
jgi:hypothetical protein